MTACSYRTSPARLSANPAPAATGSRSGNVRRRVHADALSRDLIGRFIDVTSFEHGLSRSARRGCRADLVALDRWLAEQAPRRNLISARSSDLLAYFRKQAREGWEPRLLDRLLASMHAFYQYAHDSGCLDKDPAERLPLTFLQSQEPSSVLFEPLFLRAKR